jgi:hypothetical protein
MLKDIQMRAETLLQGLSPDFELIDGRKLPRVQRRALKLAHKLDREFFHQNPSRLTRVRYAVKGEAGVDDFFPDKQCVVVVRQVFPDAHHALFAFTDSDLVEVASSENTAAELYDLLLEDEQRGWAVKSKQRASDGLLAVAPARGEA